MKFWLLIVISFCFLYQKTFAADDKKISLSPTYRFSGNARLLSEFIDRGLSVSDHNPALNASFLYNFGPQFRFGFWGSNISNLSHPDDNFWLKIVADIRVQFNDKALMQFYVHDDHFYKSDIRNGQSIGITGDYGFYSMQLEWTNNYQGSHSNAEYLNIGKSFLYKKGYLVGGKVGFTLQDGTGYQNYFDGKAYTGYILSEHTSLEAGITATTDPGRVNGRGNPAIYFGAELIF
jgi:Bacterial protein of unknown function (Gcw_chp)